MSTTRLVQASLLVIHAVGFFLLVGGMSLVHAGPLPASTSPNQVTGWEVWPPGRGPTSQADSEESASSREPTGAEQLLKLQEVNVDSGALRAQGNYVRWVPTGAQSAPTSLECNPDRLEEELLRYKGAPAVQAEKRKKYFDRCEKLFDAQYATGIPALLEFQAAKYDVFSSPYVQSIRIKFSNGEVTEGFVGIKPGHRRLPFVVVKCGLLCEGTPSTSTTAAFMNLFDESPFHVLILGSHTGTNNMVGNRRLVMGGFYEGQELMAVGQWLRAASPFKERISSLHLMGISLGGNAALMTSLYNDANPTSEGAPVYSSILAYCPAINLGPTVDDVFSGRARGLFSSIVAWNTLNQVSTSVPDVAAELAGQRSVGREEYPGLLGRLSLRFLSRLDAQTFLPPYNRKELHSVNEFWDMNNFSEQAAFVRTPLLVWAAEDDLVIPYRLNGASLEPTHLSWDGTRQLQFLGVPRGSHCAYSISYGWKVTTVVLRSFILSHLRPGEIERTVTTHRLDVGSLHLDSTDLHVSQEWRAHAGKSYLTLEFKIWSSMNGGDDPIWRDCRMTDPQLAPEHCYSTKKIRVPFAQMPISLQEPKTKPEAERLTRWLNSTIEVWSAKGPLTGGRQQPAAVRVVGY